MSRDSIRIAFTLADLNNLDIRAADIDNAYLNEECQENIWTVIGAEFISEKVKVMLVVNELYGLKSSGTSWRQMFAQTLRYLG